MSCFHRANKLKSGSGAAADITIYLDEQTREQTQTGVLQKYGDERALQCCAVLLSVIFSLPGPSSAVEMVTFLMVISVLTFTGSD